MALVAPVENGKIVETTSQSSLKNQSTSSSSSAPVLRPPTLP